MLTVGGFAPFGWVALPWIGVAVLCLLLERTESAGQSALLGFAWGLGFFLTGVSWVYVSLHDVGGMAAWLALLATLLFCAYLALFPALASWFWVRFRCVGSGWGKAVLLATAWTMTEWLRAVLFTGFPWLALGYSQTPPSPLSGFASVLGLYGVTFATVLVGALLAQMRRSRRAFACLVAVLCVGAALRWVTWTHPAGEPTTVSLIQGNIPQSIKWDPDRLPLSVDTYTRLATSHPAHLTILPETALPLYYDQIPEPWLRKLAGNGQLILGVAVRDSAGLSFNAAVAWRGDRQPQFYAKRHLVPFGEFIPPGFGWFFDLVRIPMSNFTPGHGRQVLLDVAGQKVAVNICYEDLFGNAIAESLPQAGLLVNISNTAWFGHSLAQPQHLQIARMRAIETGRPMLRATNTGMTAVIDADGTVVDQLEPFTRGAITREVRSYQGTTPYARWGDAPALLASMGALVFMVWRRKGNPVPNTA